MKSANETGLLPELQQPGTRYTTNQIMFTYPHGLGILHIKEQAVCMHALVSYQPNLAGQVSGGEIDYHSVAQISIPGVQIYRDIQRYR